MQKKRSLELSLSNLNVEIANEEQSLQLAEERITQMQRYRRAIDFSEGRETINPDMPIPSPLLLIMRAFSNALPDFVELDGYEGFIDLSDASAVVTMRGRPLTADVNLTERVEQMHQELKNQGWATDPPELSFEKKSGSFRFSDQRGELRAFILRFRIDAKGNAL
jgi:hypothetical protein